MATASSRLNLPHGEEPRSGVSNQELAGLDLPAQPAITSGNQTPEAPMDGASLYMLRCADGKLYVGLTRREVDERVSEHSQGLSAFTRPRRPVALIFSEHYLSLTDAIAAERRLKGWTRAKKLAYVAGEWERLQHLARRRTSSHDVADARGEAEACEPPGSRRRCAAPHHEGSRRAPRSSP